MQPIEQTTQIKPLLTPEIHSTAATTQANPPLPQNDSPFFKVCHNWALHLSKKNTISLTEAYESINQIIIKNTPDAAKKGELLTALEQRNWENPLFSNTEEYPYYAMACLQDGSLTLAQFTTLMLYRMECHTQNNQKGVVRSVPLFRMDPATKQMVANPVARGLIKETLKPVLKSVENPHNPDFTLFDKTQPQLTEEQLDLFFEMMAKKPASEQQFFIVPDAHAETSLDPTEVALEIIEERRCICLEIRDSVGINVFNTFSLVLPNKPEKKMRMIPSLSMMQTFLDVKFENPVTINPVICLSPLEALFKNAKERIREFGITFPGIKLPSKADNLMALGTKFPYHDFYHAIIASGVPQKHAEASLILIDILENMKKEPKYTEITDIINEFIERIIDMERPLYRKDSAEWKQFTHDISSLFWASLALDLTSAYNRMNLNQIKKQIKEPLAIIRLASTDFFEFFLVNILKRMSEFEEKDVQLRSLSLAMLKEEIALRRYVETAPNGSKFAFNQEDDFENASMLHMFQRWKALILQKP